MTIALTREDRREDDDDERGEWHTDVADPTAIYTPAGVLLCWHPDAARICTRRNAAGVAG